MYDSFCKQIDKEFLVEKYVAGKLSGDVLNKFEQHLTVCAKHANAVALEKVLKRGVREFARSEIKSHIKQRIHKREDMRIMILRFAAFLFVAVITPIILYYQFVLVPARFEETQEPGKIASDTVYSTTIHEDDLSHQAEPQTESIDITKPQDKSSSREEQAETVLRPKSSQEKISKASEAEDELQAVIPPEVNRAAPESGKSTQEYKLSSDISEEESQITGKRVGLISVSAGGEARDESSLYVSTTDQSLQEELKREISQQMVPYQTQIKTCVENFLSDAALNAYTIEIEFVVQPEGNITGVQVIKSTMESTEIEKCILEKIKTWKFQVKNTQCTVRKTFNFTMN
jgi:hypothetical protein